MTGLISNRVTVFNRDQHEELLEKGEGCSSIDSYSKLGYRERELWDV
jgi:hypothetical protein